MEFKFEEWIRKFSCCPSCQAIFTQFRELEKCQERRTFAFWVQFNYDSRNVQMWPLFHVPLNVLTSYVQVWAFHFAHLPWFWLYNLWSNLLVTKVFYPVYLSILCVTSSQLFPYAVFLSNLELVIWVLFLNPPLNCA